METKTYSIGRNGDIRINDESVSRRHAEFQLRGNEIFLRDLGSTNGTFLVKNNRCIRFHQGYLQPNQPIMLGQHIYIVSELLKQVEITS